MKVKQISVFLENTTGRLAEVTDALGCGEVNMRAISIADTADFGILRLVLAEPDKGIEILKKAGFTAKMTEVIGVEIEDAPCGLSNILKIFNEEKVNIEYLYSSLITGEGSAVIIFKVEDIDHGLDIVEKHGIKAISAF